MSSGGVTTLAALAEPRCCTCTAAGLPAGTNPGHGVIPPFVTVPDHTHLSEIFSLGLDDDALGATLARFVRRVTAAQPVPLSI